MRSSLLHLLLAAIAAPTVAGADPDVHRPVVHRPIVLRLGAASGGGLGPVGLTAAIDVVPHLGLGLDAALVLADGGRGLVLAPTIQLRARAQRSTPYIAAALPYRRVAFGDVWTGSLGLVVQGGYELVIAGRVSLQLGVGLHLQRAARGQADLTMTTQPGYLAPTADNLVRATELVVYCRDHGVLPPLDVAIAMPPSPQVLDQENRSDW